MKLVDYKYNKEDSSDLQDFLDMNSSSGSIEFVLHRESEIYSTLCVEGREPKIFIIKDSERNIIVASAFWNYKECWISGKPEKIGYLSNVRIRIEYRNTLVYFRLINAIKKYHLSLENPPKFYLACVMSDNKNAHKVFTSGKGNLGNISKYCDLNTFIFKEKRFKARNKQDISIRNAETKDIPQIIEFINSQQSEFELIPNYLFTDFAKNNGLLHSLDLASIHIAICQTEIVGILALWNQNSFRHWFVKKYSPSTQLLKPFINLFCFIFGMPYFPKKNTIINYYIFSLLFIKNNDQSIFKLLYNSHVQNISKNKNSYLTILFPSQHPLIECFNIPKIKLKSSLYILNFSENSKSLELDKSKIPYIELGSL